MTPSMLEKICPFFQLVTNMIQVPVQNLCIEARVRGYTLALGGL